MSDAEQARLPNTWELREGDARMSFAVAGGEPVPSSAEGAYLSVDGGQITLYMTNGRWALGSVVLHGYWLRKDGSGRTRRKGTVVYIPPLDTPPVAPPWLQDRVAALLDRFNGQEAQ
ncbi:hypothetical protein AB0M39_41795 [Streptomyces sp. NPDC051907]|uniref:hypothetical protein n=1 Tax=Streptomyces sp. NPDC051907 TaxID=3155284 RepID=UPI003449E858